MYILYDQPMLEKVLFCRTVRSNVAYKNKTLIPQEKDVQDLKVFVGKFSSYFCQHIMLFLFSNFKTGLI